MIKRLTQEVEKWVPKSWVEEFKTIVRHPRSLGSWIEHRSPWLNQRLLGVASNWVEPFTVGMGMRVVRSGEEAFEVLMPGGWRNQGDGGTVHTGALSALGEFAARLYWEHHLDLRSSSIESTRLQVRLLARPVGEMKAVFRLPVADREAILHRLRAENHVTAETETRIYDSNSRLVAEIEIDWELRRLLRLGTPDRH